MSVSSVTMLVATITIDGRAAGAIIMATFGAVWMLSGAAVLQRLDWRTWVVALAVSGTLCWITVRQLQRVIPPATATTTSNEAPLSASATRNFEIVLALEWPAILAVVFFLRRRGRRDLILPVIALIVGAHFLPLAMIFNSPIYYFTAAVMIGVSSASFAIHDRRNRQAVVCVSCSVALWITSAALLA